MPRSEESQDKTHSLPTLVLLTAVPEYPPATIVRLRPLWPPDEPDTSCPCRQPGGVYYYLNFARDWRLAVWKIHVCVTLLPPLFPEVGRARISLHAGLSNGDARRWSKHLSPRGLF